MFGAMAEGTPDPLIDPQLAERVVARALANGGDFAEVFCEDRAGFGLAIDESRVERAQRGGERGAGVRVTSGETTYFAHVDGLAEADLDRAADLAVENPYWNPRPVTREGVRAMLQQAWEGAAP